MIKVLLVDEEPEILSIAEIYLKKFGNFEIKTSLSAKEGLELFETGDFDAIISDYEMPEMDGLDFLKKIREGNSLIPFILFSGKGREEIIIEAFQSGADGFVQKGPNPSAIYAELAHHVEVSVSRRKAEIELRTKEYAIEHSINGVAIADYETGEIIYANSAALRMFGYKHDDLSSMLMKDFLAGGSHSELKRNIMEFIAEKDYFIGRLLVKKKDGTEFNISISITTIQPDEMITRRLIFVSFIDITTTVRAEDEFLEYLLETSRRIKKPLSLVGQSLGTIVEDVIRGEDPEAMKLRLMVLIGNITQIVSNLNDLNKTVIEAKGTISEEEKSFLYKK